MGCTAVTFIPFFGWVADAIVALVTLRKGTKEGALVLLWTILPSIIVGFFGYPQLWLYDVLATSVVTFGLAVVLRHYGSWAVVLQVGMVLGIIGVIAAHMLIPDIAQIWANDLNAYLQSIKQQPALNFNIKAMQQSAAALLQMATGIQVAFLLLMNLISLVIARWAQSLLFNPGALAQELHNVRLGSIAGGIFTVVIVAAVLGWAPAIDSVPVVMFIFLLAGLSLVHYLLAAAKKSNIWLAVFYLLFVLLFPYMTALLVLAALIDNWLNLREKFHIKNSS